MKNLFVLVLLIITSISITKVNAWTNAGEYSYFYPNGIRAIKEYTLTDDGKSIVVITADSSNKANNYYQYKLQRFNMETGAVEFDTLLISTSGRSYHLSSDGLTAFDIEQHAVVGWGYYTAYKLFDIYHSSRPYIRQETLITDKVSNAQQSINVTINKIDFLSRSNLFNLATNRSTRTRDYRGTQTNEEITGELYFIDLNNPQNGYTTKNGETFRFDKYPANKYSVYNQYYSNIGDYDNILTHQIMLVDSSKTAKEIMLLGSSGYYQILNSLKFLSDSLLLIQIDYDNNHYINYYNYKSFKFCDTIIFPIDSNTQRFIFGYSNSRKFFIKSDDHKLEYYMHHFKHPIYSVNLPKTLDSISNYKFTSDDQYLLATNESNQIIRFKNPLVDDQLKAYFVLSDTTFSAQTSYKCYNFSTGNPTKYSWDFNDGSSSNDFEPEVKFNEPGTYTIKLSAERDWLISTYERTIKVLPNLHADFEIVSIPKYLPMNCKFKNTSTSNIDSLLWDFGDGTFSKSLESIINHTFIKDFNYIVKLKVFYKTLVDSIQKNVKIEGIADQSFDPEIYTEYLFENATDNNHRICKIFKTDDNGYILVEQAKDTTKLLKTADNLIPYKTVTLNKPFNCPANNLEDIYVNNFLKFDEKKYIFYTQSDDKATTIRVFDDKLNKIKETNPILSNFHIISFPDNTPDSNIIVFESIGTHGYKNKYNVFTGSKKQIEDLGDRFYLMNDTVNVISLLDYHFAYSPVSNTYSNFSSFKLQNPINGNFIFEDIAKSNLKLKKQIPFNVFRSIDNKSFIGLDSRGNIILFNANGDSLNSLKLTSGLTNIAINAPLYYALGSKNNHPICYMFDKNLIVRDTIYIVNRDGAFLDAIILDNGDKLMAGYRYLPSKSNPNGKSIRNSYLLRMNDKVSGIKEAENIPISITNPIDHLATIRFAVDSSTTFHYEAYDFLGNLVFKTADEKIENEYTGTVDFSGLAPGVYIFKFYINSKIETKKVIYQK